MSLYEYVAASPQGRIDSLGLSREYGDDCDEAIKQAKDTPMYREIEKQMALRGCPMPDIECVDCKNLRRGGKSTGGKIIICNHLSTEEKTRAIIHELIHSWDMCRLGLKDGDPTKCGLLFCMEVRAYDYSGDCCIGCLWTDENEVVHTIITEGDKIRCLGTKAISSICLDPDEDPTHPNKACCDGLRSLTGEQVDQIVGNCRKDPLFPPAPVIAPKEAEETEPPSVSIGCGFGGCYRER
jgi:hypothetical protein